MKTTPCHRFWRSNDIIISITVYIRWALPICLALHLTKTREFRHGDTSVYKCACDPTIAFPDDIYAVRAVIYKHHECVQDIRLSTK